MNIEIVFSVLIAMFIYNIIIKAIGASVIKHILSSKPAESEVKSFSDKLYEKMNEKQAEK